MSCWQSFRRCETDDLIAAQRLQEWLEASVDETADQLTVDLNLADPGGTLDLAHRRGSDEGDFDSLDRCVLDHVIDATSGDVSATSSELLIGCVVVARSRRRIGNLPAEATIVGRRRELAELRRTLAAARLVSLVGPGGVGKTRLAVRMATDLERGFADGAGGSNWPRSAIPRW